MSCGVFEREIGFSKTRALRKRERERQTLDVVSDLPRKGKKRERRPTLDDLTQYEKKCTKREEKKKRIDSQNKTYRRKKEKERERERECFLREKRDIFPPFSLSFL